MRIRGIFHAHLQRRPAEEVFDPQMCIVGNVPLDLRRSLRWRGCLARVEFAIVCAPSRRIAQDFVRRIQCLRARDGFMRSLVEIGVVLLGKHAIRAANLRGSASAVETECGVVIVFCEFQVPTLSLTYPRRQNSNFH